jgi:hypothetical protein
MHARVSSGEKGRGLMCNMRRDMSSWLCMKSEVAFIGGQSISTWVLPPSFGDFLLFWPLCDVLMRFVAFWLPNFLFDGLV